MRDLYQRMEDINYNITEMLYKTKRMFHIIEQILTTEIFEQVLYGEALSIEQQTDIFEKKIDDEVTKTIARFQPMTINLRFLMSMIKISSDIERINDLGLNILKVIKHSKNIHLYKNQNILDMLKKIIQMFEFFSQCFHEENLTHAYLIISMDEEINDHKTQTLETLKIILNQTNEEKNNQLNYLETLFIAQHLERIGDTLKNLSEVLIYIYDGIDIRHSDNE